MEVKNEISLPENEQNEKIEKLSGSQDRKAESACKNPEISEEPQDISEGNLKYISTVTFNNEGVSPAETSTMGLQRRQSTRTKTAKNNSDYIYYSKFNESGVESSSKNGSTKRKYISKAADSKKYEGAKSAKSNSFHVPRISQKPISEKNAGYPQSCCEESSPSITSNSGNLQGISNPEFSNDPNLNKNEQQPDICSQRGKNENSFMQSQQAKAEVSDQKAPSPQGQNMGAQTRAGDQKGSISKNGGSKDQAAAAKKVTPPVAAQPETPVAVYCICRSSDEHNMIMCDCCEEWYHYKCINLTPEEFELYITTDKPFYCKQKACLEKEKKLKQPKKAPSKAEKKAKVVEKKKKAPEEILLPQVVPKKMSKAQSDDAQVDNDASEAPTAKKSKRVTKQETKEKSVSDISGLKKKKKDKKSKKADSDKGSKKQKTVFVQPGEKPQFQMNMFPQMGQFQPLGLGMPMGGMGAPMFNPAMLQLLQMNQFKKLGAGSKPPSVGGLNLFKNIPTMAGSKKPMKVEPLNLLGNFKKQEKKAETDSSSPCHSEESEVKKEQAQDSPKNVASVEQSGIIKKVFESEEHYHFSSAKAATAVDSENSGEFKLVKKDTYLEKREPPSTDFSNLFSLMRKNSPPEDELDTLIDQICSPEAAEEPLPEIFNGFDITEEEKSNLKLLSKSMKLQKIIDRIQEVRFKSAGSTQQSPAKNI